MTKTRSLGKARVQRDGKCNMPNPLPIDQVARLLKIASKHGYSLEEAHYGAMRTRMWSETNRKLRADWVMVIINGMHSGWGLRGFRDWKRRGMDKAFLRKLGLHKYIESHRTNVDSNFVLTPELQSLVLSHLQGAQND